MLPVVFPASISATGSATATDRPRAAGFRQAEPGYRYRFPYDHGTHDNFRTEWWYYTGHLTAENGRRFGYQVTFFRRGIEPERVGSNPSRWAIRQLYLAHVALSDLDQQRFRYAEKISRAGLGKAGAEAGRLRVWIDQWSVEASGSPHEHHRLQVAGGEFSLDLTVTPEKQPVVHGKRGVSRKGAHPAQTSHYYSFPRLATEGTLSVDGERLSVQGTSWMDHEFGSGDLGDDITGWDWFSVQLDNRIELMLYRLRRTDGTVAPVSSGTVIHPDGRTQHLSAADVQVETYEYWSSRTSGGRYPSRWRIAVPSLALSLDVRPLLPDQELVTSRSTRVTYWEGAVQVTGELHGAPVSGEGYVELTGYAKAMRKRL
ncbi:MAG TPA: lipocalin-like domain-containing protein [Nitrospiraceae bacterium]